MTIRNLEYLLQPKSVVFIGASPVPGTVGSIIAQNLGAYGFKGPVWFVNPRYTEVHGQPCYASVADVPGAPDLAVIATPARTMPGLVAELGAKGTRAAVVISAGVDKTLRQAMLDAAKPNLLRIQGPNCLGLMLPHLGLNASFAHCMPPAGDLAFVSQSGALITAVADWAVGRGIGFSQIVSVGDMADADFGDLLDYLAGDRTSRAILLYMEQLTHAPKFISAARRASRAKPVLVLKAGRHASGAKAAMSHTGALAGSDSAYNAAFRRAGIVRVLELEDLFEAAEILARNPRLEGERLLILTNGGGAGVLAADRLADLDGSLAELSVETRAALDVFLPPTWSKGNPVDIIGDANAERYERALDVLMDAEGADAILAMNCPTALASSTDIARSVIAVRQQRKQLEKPAKPLLTNWLGDGAAVEARKLFASERIASFETPASAVEGFMHLVRYKRAQAALMRTPPISPPGAAFDAEVVSTIISGALAQGRNVLSEIEAKTVLAAYGIPIAPTATANTIAEVATHASSILAKHAACAIKIWSDDITHKSDVGGVRLDLASVTDAVEAARQMHERIAREHPAARLLGFTVQPMIRRPRATELLAGMSVDPTFGPILTFGAGGTAVEVLRDTAQALPPLDAMLARDMMRETRVMRLLDGYRDRPAANQDAIAQAMVSLSALIIAHPEIRELDINPLLADHDGVIALDARIRVEDQARTPRQPMSIRPYPVAWVKRVEVPKIGKVVIRPIRPEDEHLYARLIGRVDPQDMRMRFFVARPDLSHQLIARLTQIDYAREMAFVAIDEAKGEILGVARLIADPDYRRAEYAIIIASDLKGLGLGWLLMNHLISYARSEGLAELYGLVLNENKPMLDMCRDLGFKIEAEPDDGSVSRVTLALRTAALPIGRTNQPTNSRP